MRARLISGFEPNPVITSSPWKPVAVPVLVFDNINYVVHWELVCGTRVLSVVFFFLSYHSWQIILFTAYNIRRIRSFAIQEKTDI